MDSYNEAHLFVAAIRIVQEKKKAPPGIEEVCELLGISSESGHAVCRSLTQQGILEALEDPFSVKLIIADHLAIEKIARETKDETSLSQELAQFQAKKKNAEKHVADIQAQIDRKKKDMLSEIEAKFKKEMDRLSKEWAVTEMV